MLSVCFLHRHGDDDRGDYDCDDRVTCLLFYVSNKFMLELFMKII